MKKIWLCGLLLVSELTLASFSSQDNEPEKEKAECCCRECECRDCVCDDDCSDCRGCYEERRCYRHCWDNDDRRDYRRHNYRHYEEDCYDDCCGPRRGGCCRR